MSPVRTIHCKRCGAAISGYDFAERMRKLRRHYKEKHLRTFKKSVRNGVATRKVRRRRRGR